MIEGEALAPYITVEEDGHEQRVSALHGLPGVVGWAKRSLTDSEDEGAIHVFWFRAESLEGIEADEWCEVIWYE